MASDSLQNCLELGLFRTILDQTRGTSRSDRLDLQDGVKLKRNLPFRRSFLNTDSLQIYLKVKRLLKSSKMYGVLPKYVQGQRLLQGHLTEVCKLQH